MRKSFVSFSVIISGCVLFVFLEIRAGDQFGGGERKEPRLFQLSDRYPREYICTFGHVVRR